MRPRAKRRSARPAARGTRHYVTSAFLKHALDRGAELFKWDERKARSGKRNGSKVRGLGVGVSAYSAGSIGFDGLLVIKPDGRLAVQSGIGNLGTESVSTSIALPPKSLGHPVGEGRHHLGQHLEVPAEYLRPGRQPDDARDDASRARSGE